MKYCEAIRVELPAYAGGKLDGDSAAPVQAHLESCADCRDELAELERLEALLCEALSPITPSVTFASRFANRLAAEVAEADEASPGRGWLGWLLRPWVIPVAAAALVVAMMLRPWSADHSASVVPMPALSGGSNRPDRFGEEARCPISRSRRANPLRRQRSLRVLLRRCCSARSCSSTTR